MTSPIHIALFLILEHCAMQRCLIHGLLVLALVTLGICFIQREMRKSLEARHTCVCGSSIAAMNLECQILNEKKHEKNVRYVLPLSVYLVVRRKFSKIILNDGFLT